LRAIDGWRLRHDPWIRRSYGTADLILGVAPYVRHLLSGIPIRRFEVMSETGIVSLPKRTQDHLGTPPGSIRLLFVGRIVRTKGVRDAVRAMRHLSANAGITLDIVGSGEDLPNCQHEAAALGLDDRVVFHGALPREEIDSFYRRADILLFPSLREPSGNVVLEAMAHGLALIVADNGGPAAAVDETCGIRVPVTTPDQYPVDLADAVRRLIQNPALLHRLRQGARSRAEQVFLWDRKIGWMCQQYEQVLSETASANGNPAGSSINRPAEHQCLT
jgi:glycosyltransferase involved in cell wall biosynthesis